jgi:acyl carrier protein
MVTVSDGSHGGRAEPAVAREDVLSHVIQTIERIIGDWELEEEITENSTILGDIGLESIDAVALATDVAETYGRQLPFADFLSARLEADTMDFTVGELVDFITRELNA